MHINYNRLEDYGQHNIIKLMPPKLLRPQKIMQYIYLVTAIFQYILFAFSYG